MSKKLHDIINLSILEIIGLILASITFVLLAGNIIFTITESKVHYVFFAAASILVLFFTFRLVINVRKLIYFIPLLISFIYNFNSNIHNQFFVLSILPYFIVPLVFYNRYFNDFNLTHLLKVFEWFTVLNFLGLLLQLQGIESPFLYLGHAFTNDNYHERYGSFAGGTLALGLGATITVIDSFHKIIFKKDKTAYTIFILILSVTTMILAQSRRFYIIAFIMMLLIYFANPQKIYNRKKIIKIFRTFIIIAVAFFILMFKLQDQSFFIERLVSIFDFKNDLANLERISKWLLAIEQFFNHLWLGMGIGAAGIIGKGNTEEINVAEVFVAESYYLKVFVEAGIFSGLTFLVLIFLFLKDAIASLQDYEKSLAAFFVIFFFIDCFMSTSIEGPLWATIFWLSVAKVSKYSSN